MSPVKETAPRSVVMAVVTSLMGIAAAVALIVFLLARGSDSNVEIRLGTEHFEAGSAAQRAESIERDGPILFTDAAGGTRDIYLQHLGATDTEGWLAFDARQAGSGRECTLEWQPAQAHFVDPCDQAVVPADGSGLLQYPVEVTEDEQLVIDIRSGST